MAFTWQQCAFILEMTAAVFVFSAAMKRKKHFWKRFFIFLIPALIVSGFIPNSIPKFLLEMLVTCASICYSYEVSWKKAVYCADCAYAVQHLSYVLEAVLYMRMRKSIFHAHALLLHGPDFSWEFWTCHIIVYGGIYLLLLRNGKQRKTYDVSVRQVWIFSTGVLAVVLVLSALVQQYLDENQSGPILICYLYSALCCIFIMILEYGICQNAVLKNELSMIHRLWIQRQEQYMIAKKNIASINEKCHELKKEISKIQQMDSLEHLKTFLEELQKEIQIYDAVVKTGNEALDIVLTEKSLYCNAQQITLACVADGEKLDFMDAADIYMLFEEGLGYAISQVTALEDVQKRQVAVSVWTKSNLLLIQIENYCEPKPEYENMEIQENMPYLIEKYGGYMTGHFENSLFIQRISFPLGTVCQ